MLEVAQPWDPCLGSGGPPNSHNPSHTPWLLSNHCKGQPRCHLLPGMPTLLPSHHILCDLQGPAALRDRRAVGGVLLKMQGGWQDP